MARRVSTVAVQIEQVNEFNNRRVSTVALEVEYFIGQALYPTGIPSEEAFGVPEVLGGVITGPTVTILAHASLATATLSRAGLIAASLAGLDLKRK